MRLGILNMDRHAASAAGIPDICQILRVVTGPAHSEVANAQADSTWIGYEWCVSIIGRAYVSGCDAFNPQIDRGSMTISSAYPIARSAILLSALCLLACGDDDSGSRPDGGADAGTTQKKDASTG